MMSSVQQICGRMNINYIWNCVDIPCIRLLYHAVRLHLTFDFACSWPVELTYHSECHYICIPAVSAAVCSSNDLANSRQSKLVAQLSSAPAVSVQRSWARNADLPSRASIQRAYVSSGLKDSVSFLSRWAEQIVVNFFGTRWSLFSTLSSWIVCAVSRTTNPRRPT